MRPEVVALLREAGVASAEIPWERIVLTSSRGSLIDATLPEYADPAERGFQFLVLSPSGAPTHHCKCCQARPEGGFHRRAEVLALLERDPRARPHLTRATTVRNERIELHITEYIDAPPLDRLVGRLGMDRAWPRLARVLDAAAALSWSFMEAQGKSAVERVSLPDIAAASLDEAADLGVPSATLASLRGGLAEAGRVPRVPQHGDLWPANILVSPDGEVRLLDLDRFGLIDAPLYDVFHLLRTLGDLTPPRGTATWLEGVLGSGPSGARARGIVAREARRWGLDPSSVGGSLLFYLLHVAVRLHRRGGWTRFLAELPAARARLERLGSVEALGAALTRTDA